jgi:LmbE family N-acetylglucosaminyl deacetylase
MTNPYLSWVQECEKWMAQGKRIQSGTISVQASSGEGLPVKQGGVLLFSPHPDDECIIGALPLRLGREAGLAITNIAVTLGSKKDRKAGRWAELRNACAFLGWAVQQVVPGGFDKISAKGRAEDPANWKAAVSAVAGILKAYQPRMIVFPHANDWNASHMGVHHLMMEALAQMPATFSCLLIETEFWAAMESPNLMVESTVGDVADMVAAISLHVGEVQRNPYHLTLPAWMQDNVRRGGELVGGQGGAAPDYLFCTLYRLSGWKQGAIRALTLSGRTIAKGQSVKTLWDEAQTALGAV